MLSKFFIVIFMRDLWKFPHLVLCKSSLLKEQQWHGRPIQRTVRNKIASAMLRVQVCPKVSELQFILCLYLEFSMFYECLVNVSLIANCSLLHEKLIIIVISSLLTAHCSVKYHISTYKKMEKRNNSQKLHFICVAEASAKFREFPCRAELQKPRPVWRIFLLWARRQC